MAHPNHQGNRDSRIWRKRVRERERRGGLKTIPAGRARKRLILLSRHGVGRRAVHEVTGIAHSTLRRIKNGKTRYVRRETRDLIFSVAIDAHCDRALIDASETWRLIKRMTTHQDMGFTQAEIERRLGTQANRPCPTLQIGRKRITAKKAMQIEQLYNRVTLGEAA